MRHKSGGRCSVKSMTSPTRAGKPSICLWVINDTTKSRLLQQAYHNHHHHHCYVRDSTNLAPFMNQIIMLVFCSIRNRRWDEMFHYFYIMYINLWGEDATNNYTRLIENLFYHTRFLLYTFQIGFSLHIFIKLYYKSNCLRVINAWFSVTYNMKHWSVLLYV